MVGFVFLVSRFTEEMSIGKRLFSQDNLHVFLLPADPQYSIFVRTYIITFVVFKLRLKFYFVWFLADSINNLCGLGFSGYDERGQPKWNLTTNAISTNVEFASNPREILANWNICSASWLRRYGTFTVRIFLSLTPSTQSML